MPTDFLVEQIIIHRIRGGERAPEKPNVKQRRRQMVLGSLTLDRFRKAVTRAFNMASRTGQGIVLYRARRRLGKIVLGEKLYQAKRGHDNVMFSTFHSPTGRRLRVEARLSSAFERSPDVVYPG